MEDTSTTYAAPKQRSTLLTIMCILTFIGSGLGVLQSGRSILMAGSIAQESQEKMAQAEDKMGDNAPSFLKNFMGSAMQNINESTIRQGGIFGLIKAILALTGAIMMWQLRKTGYYLYAGAAVVSILSPMIISSGTIAVMGAVGSAVIGALFLALYGINLKDMS